MGGSMTIDGSQRLSDVRTRRWDHRRKIFPWKVVVSHLCGNKIWFNGLREDLLKYLLLKLT